MDIEKNQVAIEVLKARLAEAKLHKAKWRFEEKPGSSRDGRAKKAKMLEVMPSLVNNNKVHTLEEDSSEEEMIKVYAQIIKSKTDLPPPTLLKVVKKSS